jgi:hypothetical protein
MAKKNAMAVDFGLSQRLSDRNKPKPEKKMSTTTYFIDPAELLLQPVEKKSRETKPSFAKASSDRAARPSSNAIAEERLWKLTQPAASTKTTIVELAFLLLVLALAIAAMAGCCTELFHLMQSDAIGHVAALALGAGA